MSTPPTQDIWQVFGRLTDTLDPALIFDVGAHQGSMVDYFRRRFPRSRVHGFEPDPATFATLTARCAGDPQVTLTNAALSDRAGRLSFNRGHYDATSSLFPRNTTGRRYYNSRYSMLETIEVESLTLDDYCQRAGVQTINLLKLDTQGAELSILRGANGLLEAGAIDVIVTEFFYVPHYEGAPLLDEIWSFLRSKRYDLFDIATGAYGQDGQARFGDAIFLSPQFRERRYARLPQEP